MSYTKTVKFDRSAHHAKRALISTTTPDRPSVDSEFYELEPALVHRVILDEDDDLIPTIKGGLADKDYSYVGRIVCRPIYSHDKTPDTNLPIAIPLETNVTEYPLKNEIVIVAKYFGKYYYSRKLNLFNLVNTNFDYTWNREYAANKRDTSKEKRARGYSSAGAPNVSDKKDGKKYVLGKVFEENLKIHPLRPFEGDLILQSRFGSSVRFGAYNDGKLNKFDGEHPQILIRNRESTELQKEDFSKPIEEDINKDGSSIHITSGDIRSKFVSEIDTKVASSEYPNKLDGDQIIVTSGRLIFSSRKYEIIGLAKKSIGWATDGIFSVDSKDDTVITTQINFVVNSIESRLNSNTVYLGEEENKDEPVVLGTQMYEWLDALCNALIGETHATGTGPSTPPINVAEYVSLKSTLRRILSRRVFTV